MAVPGLEFQIFSPRSWRACKYQVKEFGILLEGNRDLLTVTNSLIYERRHFPLEYTQINCTSIKEVSKPFLFLWALVKPLGLVPLYAVKTVYAIWLSFGVSSCRVSGHEPHPCLKYTWQSFSGCTFFMPPLHSEVMDLCIGVILSKVI